MRNVGCASVVAIFVVGCGPPPTVAEHPWPNNEWIGVVEYRGRGQAADDDAKESVLKKAERECNGPFRVLGTQPTMVGRTLYVNGIKASEPTEGTAMIFQCLEPERARRRCDQLDRPSDSMRRQKCFQRMDGSD